MSEPKLSAGAGFARLVEIMARLRAPGGCPWDREQNFDTIKPYLLEETYEVMDAIDAGDWEGLAASIRGGLSWGMSGAIRASAPSPFPMSCAVRPWPGWWPAPCQRRMRRSWRWRPVPLWSRGPGSDRRGPAGSGGPPWVVGREA